LSDGGPFRSQSDIVLGKRCEKFAKVGTMARNQVQVAADAEVLVVR
jgi:GTPase Era involved in 16S rRNA processing